MQKNYFLLLLGVLCTFNSLEAQDKFIKFNPLGLLDPFGAKFQVAYERVTPEGLGVEIELGRYCNSGLNSLRTDHRGWMGSMEIRKYYPFRPKSRFYNKLRYLSRFYTAFDYQYIHRFFTILGDRGVNLTIDNIPVAKKISRLALKFGTADSFPSGFTIDWAVLVGLSQVRTIHKNGPVGVEEGSVFVDTDEAGARTRIYLGVNLRLSLALKKMEVFKRYQNF